MEASINRSTAMFDAPGAELLLGDSEPDGQLDLRAVGTHTATGKSFNDLAEMIADVMGGHSSQRQGGLTPRQQTESLVGWVFVCISRIRDAVARTPLRVYRTQRDGRPLEIKDPQFPLAQLLANPNEFDTRSDFWAQTITFLELSGNAFWLKLRDGVGRTRELWHVPTHLVKPLHAPGDVLWGYELSGAGGQTVPVPREDFVHFRYPNPKDRFWGLGTLAAAASAMKSQNAIKAAQLAAFQNDILSSLFFATDQLLNEGDWKRILANLIERHSGIQKAGLPVLLYGGVKPVASTHKPNEMAFQESASFTRDEILGIFGVPPLLAGVVEHANNSNTASQERVFAQYTVHPRLVNIQDRINKSLSPAFGQGIEVEFDSPVPDDKLLEATLDSKQLAAGWKAPNEIRERDGLEPQPWGEAPRWWIELQKNKAPSAGANRAVQAGPLSPGPNPSKRQRAALHASLPAYESESIDDRLARAINQAVVVVPHPSTGG